MGCGVFNQSLVLLGPLACASISISISGEMAKLCATCSELKMVSIIGIGLGRLKMKPYIKNLGILFNAAVWK